MGGWGLGGRVGKGHVLCYVIRQEGKSTYEVAAESEPPPPSPTHSRTHAPTGIQTTFLKASPHSCQFLNWQER